MGILRLYLAVCVVFVHSGIRPWWTTHDGTESVQIFFMISGFYMQLIGDKYADARSFWMSRMSRIYFPFFIAVLISILTAGVIWLTSGNLGPWHGFTEGPVAPELWRQTVGMSLTNLTIVGAEQALFLERIDASRFILVPQAWSMALEIYFYAMVPWLVRRNNRFLCGLLLSSVVLRFGAYLLFGLTHDPWTYRFFPFELSLFIGGMLACRYGLPATKKIAVRWSNPRYLAFCLAALTSFWALRKFVSFGARFVGYAYLVQLSYVAWLIVIPLLFAITKNNRIDRAIGELSYPMYLLHIAAIAMSQLLCQWLKSDSWFSVLVLGLSLASSIVVSNFLIRPLDRWRQRFMKKAHEPMCSAPVEAAG